MPGKDTTKQIHKEEPCDALQRSLNDLAKDFNYKPITWQRAEEIADLLTDFDDDRIAFGLIELLHGICAEAFSGGRINVESLVMPAAWKAYTKTSHFSSAFKEFASLDPSNERDRRVIDREFDDENETIN